jgi:hypothetical protein
LLTVISNDRHMPRTILGSGCYLASFTNCHQGIKFTCHSSHINKFETNDLENFLKIHRMEIIWTFIGNTVEWILIIHNNCIFPYYMDIQVQ